MKKLLIGLLALGSVSSFATTEFDARKLIRCTEGDHDSKILVIHNQEGDLRLLSFAGGRDIAQMTCTESEEKVICTYEVSSFFGSREKTLTLDLTSVYANYELNDQDISHYVLDANINGYSLICRQDAN
jgi:hypothetical protein